MASTYDDLLTANCGKMWAWSYTTTGANESVTITFTWTGGGTTFVDWGDGTVSEITSAVQATHVYAVAGTYSPRLVSRGVWNRLTTIDGCSSNGGFTGEFKNAPSGLSLLRLYQTNTALTGPASDLPRSLTFLHLWQTSSALTGLLSDLPSRMTLVHLAGTNSSLTGALSDLPSGITTLDLSSTTSEITGGTSAISAIGLATLHLTSTSDTQADLDDVLLRLYTDRASFTYASPELEIAGTNPAPSGVYQDASPPTTGKEYAYKLVVDPDAEGFNKWTITMN